MIWRSKLLLIGVSNEFNFEHIQIDACWRQVMANILVVYGAKSYPLRATTEDHLYCFRRYSNQRCFYFNSLILGKPWYRKLPSFLRRISFDLVIFYLDLLNIQWSPYSLEKFVKQAQYFKETQATKVALVQDEFYNTDSLGSFISEFKIDHVFSLADPSEWAKIYSTVDFEKVNFHRSLPGYLDEEKLAEIERLASFEKDRPITIGYRAIRYPNLQWRGRHGFKKFEIADIFERKAREFGISTDISTNAKDVFLGNEWYRFLLRSQYTIALEGGASILDHDGSVRQRTEAYLAEHPQACFDEVEQACFPGRDGELNYMAISPKHLESCATKTCQILVEGNYNGILTPGIHYIELKSDFSNIDQVLRDVKEDRLRSQIVERAYKDIVGSGTYTYRSFVHWVLELVLPNQPIVKSYKLGEQLLYAWSRLFELYQWAYLAVLSGTIRNMRRFFPAAFEAFLRRLVA
jgi:hypothetical protein